MYRTGRTQRLLSMAELKTAKAERGGNYLPSGRINHLLEQSEELTKYANGDYHRVNPKRKGIPPRIPKDEYLFDRTHHPKLY